MNDTNDTSTIHTSNLNSFQHWTETGLQEYITYCNSYKNIKKPITWSKTHWYQNDKRLFIVFEAVISLRRPWASLWVSALAPLSTMGFPIRIGPRCQKIPGRWCPTTWLRAFISRLTQVYDRYTHKRTHTHIYIYIYNYIYIYDY